MLLLINSGITLRDSEGLRRLDEDDNSSTTTIYSADILADFYVTCQGNDGVEQQTILEVSEQLTLCILAVST